MGLILLILRATPMFKSDGHSPETIIGPSVHVEGDLKSQGNIQVEGAVSGAIQTSGNLMVGEAAKIRANVQAMNAQVSGYIKGNVTVSERLELSPKARIDGDVVAKVLAVAEGAQLNGRCQMGATATQPTQNPNLARPNKKDKPQLAEA